MTKHTKQKKYYANQRQEMLQYIPSSAKKILEIGCGEGNFGVQLLGNDKEIWGVEPYEKSAHEAQKKLNKVLIGTIDETLNDLPDNYFDAIVLNDVLEHLLEPWDDIAKLKDKLIKGGVMVTSIPNVRYSKNLFKLLFHKDWKYTEDNILDATHFRFFTKKSIKRLFLENGFKIEKIKGINRTKSFAYLPFAIVFNILFLGSQLDMLYMQYATVAKKAE